jgi:hypothetical protein
VASTKGVSRTRKKYVPSAKQRAEDARIKEKLDHLTDADVREFDRLLGKAIHSKEKSD